ncbi:vitamin D3 receptor-like [Acanthaster planci]|uniref:Vitamin D3 receptor-like n=1 Tax=Acanthaster planci TaxID=133434 RepID=A0A8B7YKW9_ACAPL|nr:vitamin D3 receptor-like [Acanthaster planci]XP_022093075.1 vitamin D3 receptor-like [Acanthaster planci]
MADVQTEADISSAKKKATESSASKEERLCLICGDRANGVHYNVLSCEGCKSFFLRSTKSKATFTCSQGGKCSMDLYTRRHCPACRMKRCVELGMSVDRVWDEDRLKTRKRLIRVKRKKKQPISDPNHTSSAQRSMTSPSTSTKTSAANSPAPAPVTPTLTPNLTPVTTPGVTPGTESALSPGANQVMTPDIAALMSSVMMPGFDLNTMQSLTPTVPEPQWELTEEQQNLVERLEKGYLASKEVFKNIFPKAPGSIPIPEGTNGNHGSSIFAPPTTAAALTVDATSSNVEAPAPTTSSPKNPLNALTSLLPEGMTPAKALTALATGELNIPERFSLGDLLPSGLSSIASSLLCSDSIPMPGAAADKDSLGDGTSDPEKKEAGPYQSIQRVTSFITNGSMKESGPPPEKPKLPIHKELLHTAMDMFAILVKQTIHFAKTIPGFMDLMCDDQAVLIKASIMDALLLRCAESYVPDMGCVINEMTNDLFHINMMYQMGYTSLPEQAFQFMKETKECGLTTAEYALLNAVAILSPDRTELQNRELVEEIQLSIVETLHAATKVFHQEDRTLFAKLIMKLTKMRDIAVVHLSDLMEVQVQERDLSPLIIELFGLDTSSAS